MIGNVRAEDAFEMGFAEDDRVVHPFSTDRTDLSFDVEVLPERPRGGQHFALSGD
jgi:hypothetical protein